MNIPIQSTRTLKRDISKTKRLLEDYKNKENMTKEEKEARIKKELLKNNRL